jgi:pimeloyl-ACP methyl ester carboxylesterase
MKPWRVVHSALGIVAIAAAVGVALIWAPDRPSAALESRWAAPPSTWLQLEGLRVHIRDEGPRDDPQPLVLLHGTSASLHTWDGWASALRDGRRVIRFDLPGFGLTGPLPPLARYDFETYVRVVLGVFDALGLDRVVLAGNSFGGNIAWEVAAAAPGRVDALILVDSAGFPPSATSIPLGFRLARTPVVRDLMEYVLPRSVVTSSLRNVYGDPSRVTPELVDRYYELTLRAGNRAALPRRLAEAPAGQRTHLLAEVRAPTLILWGERDRLIPPSDAQLFARALPGAELHVLPGLGHVPHEEDPETTTALVRSFLARVAGTHTTTAATATTRTATSTPP